MRHTASRLVFALIGLMLSHQALAGETPAPTGGPAAAALAGWDDETGLWFPPDAPREVYLTGLDPKHWLIRDVERAFEASPDLRRAVCALAFDPKHQPNPSRLPPKVHQLKSTFDMLCVAATSRERTKAGQGVGWQKQEAQYEGWVDVANARTLSWDQRLRRAREIDERAGRRMLPIEAGFRMLGLCPHSSLAIYRILQGDTWRGTRSEQNFYGAVRHVLESHAAPGMPESGRYRMALRNFLYYRGDLETARRMSRELLAVEELKEFAEPNRVFAALLDRLLGDPAPLRTVLAACATPERKALRGLPRDTDCRDVVKQESQRLCDLLREKAPPALVEILGEEIAARPTDWPRRLDLIHSIVVLDAAAARRHAEELLAVPATVAPLAARLDAFALVGKTSTKLGDFGRAWSAWDLYLANLRYRPVPVPEDLWSRLSKLPQAPGGPAVEDGSSWLFITYALSGKTNAAIAAHDFPLAKRCLEEFLATALAMGDASVSRGRELWKLVDSEHLEPSQREQLRARVEGWTEGLAQAARQEAAQARWTLGSLGGAMVKAGRNAEARGILAYLLAQPGGEFALLDELRDFYYETPDRGEPRIEPAARPWPVLPPAAVPTMPGPRRRRP